MFRKLIQNIQQSLPLTEEELNYFLPMLEYRFVKKNELFIRAGSRADYLGYVDSGLLRYYYNDGAKEYTTSVVFANQWVGDYTSFLRKKTATLNISALEDSVVFLLYYDSVQKAYDKSKTFERLGRIIAESLFIAFESRSASFLIKNPEERYIDLVTKRPEMLEKIPLKYISSMLGIQPESLSRIRKRVQVGKTAQSMFKRS
ncbi:MAG: Crp/Fnr family transcriptional regulator [Agriterribacter sp.]